jgi:NADPH:quinone reductase-like Zn-dependent oxidoreductase
VKAITFERYGSADVLELRDVDKPSPKDDELLIRVHAVAINDWDWQALQGIPLANRATFGLLRPRRRILGSDVAGRVEAVGKSVSRFKPGAEVFGDLSGRWGGFAEYVCAPETALAPKPAGMTFLEAAAIPQAGVLAVQGLIEEGRLGAAQRVLINGAGGGVGTLGVQIAKTYGAEVTGVDSASKLERMRALGFDHLVAYDREDVTKSGQRYDLILDVKTIRSPLDYLRVLAPGGAYVTMGGATGRLLQTVLMRPLVSAVAKKRVGLVIMKANKHLPYLTELFEAGKLRPVIDKVYPLAQTPEAMGYFGEAKQIGKVVISVQGQD